MSKFTVRWMGLGRIVCVVRDRVPCGSFGSSSRLFSLSGNFFSNQCKVEFPSRVRFPNYFRLLDVNTYTYLQKVYVRPRWGSFVSTLLSRERHLVKPDPSRWNFSFHHQDPGFETSTLGLDHEGESRERGRLHTLVFRVGFPNFDSRMTLRSHLSGLPSEKVTFCRRTEDPPRGSLFPDRYTLRSTISCPSCRNIPSLKP